MKKSCKGCKAFTGDVCGLGYKIKLKIYDNFVTIGGIPLEKCPKPLTYDQYFKSPFNVK